MTPRQRLLAAIAGEEVDRLPFTTYNCHRYGWGSHSAYPEYTPIFEAIDRTGSATLCKTRAAYSGGIPDSEYTETLDGDVRVTTETLPTPAGPLQRVVRTPPGQPGMCVEHLIKTDEDIERFLAIEPDPVSWNTDGLMERIAEIGENGLAYVSYFDPFGRVVSYFDQENFLIRMITDPDPIFALIDNAFKLCQVELEGMLKALSEAGAVCLLYTTGPELATPPLMSPDVFGKVITPYQTRLVEMIHHYGFTASVHCHGRVAAALDQMMACGFDVAEPIEPPPQGDIDLAELRRQTEGRMALLGYVQDQDLHNATGRQIRDHVAGIVEVVGRDTGYMASPTCTPFQFPPTEAYVANYVAYLEAAAELGA